MSKHNDNLPDPSALRQTFYNQDDELDLLDLLAQLWRGKAWILGSALVCLLLAGVYLMVAKQKWTSEAIVTQPSAGQVANYNVALNVLYAQYPQDKLGIADLQQQLFGRFSASMYAEANALQNLEDPLNLKVEPVTKGDKEPLSIKYTGESARQAQQQVTHYIKIVNDQVVDDYGADIRRNLAVKERELKDSLASKEKVLEDKKQQRLDVLRQALKIAEAANISESRLTQAEFLSDDTLYLLGSKPLAAMIANESTKPLAFDDDYYATKRALSAIQTLKIQVDNLQSFRYIMQPDLPIRRDSPKKALVIVLAVLLGGMLGAGIVLGRNLLANYQRRN
ncbi:LPS O-antigen chain length determinant protein WzzB [Pantoea sp. 1.19]|uniref:LPS O-antigen chain length determinant protein WzzB n=1 Tax=Pantoea sp. 1.19 TaxID=1925589 RepID=UPI0009FABC85|nr:LPS O-antigen chain length determinant protein WzzB [Pantoea sp. 1.19]